MNDLHSVPRAQVILTLLFQISHVLQPVHLRVLPHDLASISGSICLIIATPAQAEYSLWLLLHEACCSNT